MAAKARTTRNTAKPAADAGPAPGAAAETRYYDPNVTWSAGQGEMDQPVPASGAAEPAVSVQVSGQNVLAGERAAQPGHRDWAMGPAGMVAAERPAVALGGEQAPRGGGVRGHDFVTSPGGPPVAAGEKTAAAARGTWSTGVSNSGAVVDARPWDKARMGDEETTATTETAHSVGGEPGLSGAAVSN